MIDTSDRESDMQNHRMSIGHNNPPPVEAVSWLAGRRAIIRRRGRPVESAGRAHEDEWILTFERITPPEIDELMGWTGGDDPLATEVRLTFATCAEAIAYAEREGLAYSAGLEAAPRGKATVIAPWQWSRRPAPPVGQALRASTRKPSLMGEASSGHRPDDLPDWERALANPAAVFATPWEIVDHPRLETECKRELLRRWGWDEYLKEVAAAEGMAEGESSRLDEVKAALLSLDEAWRPKPVTPAAFASSSSPPGALRAA
ncbi:MAG TPA: ETC complex I subunit [Methylorubrum populi]|uniref:ETC complex I subunit n=1 Tax=Methylorubrum populi TaxID=223967 RepID=A0A921JGD3_9HYPH|nr:ETC complex I subunit [Methylorubrum populi]